MRKLLLCIVFLISSISLYAEELMDVYASLKHWERIIDIMADDIKLTEFIYTENTEKDLERISMYAHSLYLAKEPKAIDYAQIPLSYFLNKYNNAEDIIKELSREDSRVYIQTVNQDYIRFCLPILFIGGEHAKQVSELHHRIVVGNIHALEEGDAMDVAMLPKILATDVYWMILNGKDEIFLNEYFPILLGWSKKYGIENKELSSNVYGALCAYKPIVTKIIHEVNTSTSNNRNKEKTLKSLTDYLIVMQEIDLYEFGNQESANYYTYSWEHVKKALNINEAAILLYEDYLYNKYVCFTFDSKSKYPSVRFLEKRYSTTINDLSLSNEIIYLSFPFGGIKYDLIDTCQNIYLKQSLYDVVRRRNINKSYSSKQSIKIELFCGIQYQREEECPFLKDDQKLRDSLLLLFPNQVRVTSKDTVQNGIFMNISKTTNLIHISTHGRADLTPLIMSADKISLADNITKWRNQQSSYLCLSNYAVGDEENILSAPYVCENIKLTDDTFVYLDACYTATPSKNHFSDYLNITKAFYIAGSRNIISYSSSVNALVATDFAISFYKKLSSDSNLSYHDAFYITKKEIYSKYENGIFRRKEHIHSPMLNILYWE